MEILKDNERYAQDIVCISSSWRDKARVRNLDNYQSSKGQMKILVIDFKKSILKLINYVEMNKAFIVVVALYVI